MEKTRSCLGISQQKLQHFKGYNYWACYFDGRVTFDGLPAPRFAKSDQSDFEQGQELVKLTMKNVLLFSNVEDVLEVVPQAG